MIRNKKADASEAYQYSLVAYSSFLSGSVSLAVVIVPSIVPTTISSLSVIRCRAEGS